MLVEEMGQTLNLTLYDHDDAPRTDEFLGRFLYIFFSKISWCRGRFSTVTFF